MKDFWSIPFPFPSLAKHLRDLLRKMGDAYMLISVTVVILLVAASPYEDGAAQVVVRMYVYRGVAVPSVAVVHVLAALPYKTGKVVVPAPVV